MAGVLTVRIMSKRRDVRLTVLDGGPRPAPQWGLLETQGCWQIPGSRPPAAQALPRRPLPAQASSQDCVRAFLLLLC